MRPPSSAVSGGCRVAPTLSLPQHTPARSLQCTSAAAQAGRHNHHQVMSLLVFHTHFPLFPSFFLRVSLPTRASRHRRASPLPFRLLGARHLFNLLCEVANFRTFVLQTLVSSPATCCLSRRHKPSVTAPRPPIHLESACPNRLLVPAATPAAIELDSTLRNLRVHRARCRSDLPTIVRRRNLTQKKKRCTLNLRLCDFH